MRNNRVLSLLSCLAAVALTSVSCVKSNRIYDETASVRKEESIEKYRSAILGRKQWIMEYFPDENQRYGGWIYVLEFHDDYTVKVWFEGSEFIPQSEPVTESEYNIEFGTGPMLKFCTNNDYIHFFSFPGGDNGGGYQGWGGDFEFSFLSVNESCDEIILRGNRNHNTIRLVPLPGETTPEEYIESVIESELRVDKTSFDLCVDGVVIGSVTREELPVTNIFTRFYKSKIWNLRYSNADGEEVKVTLSSINLPGGVMRFYAPYTFELDAVEGLAGQSIQFMQWTKGTFYENDFFRCMDSYSDVVFK